MVRPAAFFGVEDEFLIEVLDRGTDFRRNGEGGIERDLIGGGNFLFESERQGFVVDMSCGREMIDDETAVLADIISGKAGILGAERRDEFEPVATLVQIALDE